MRKKKFIVITLVFVFSLAFLNCSNCYSQLYKNGDAQQDAKDSQDLLCQDLFVGGQGNISQFRIPSLVTANNGTLVAVCDARVDRPGDAPNNIDLVMRRSFDNGKTWSKQRTIFNYPGNEAACDASMVVDKQTGNIWIAYDYAIPEPQGNRGRIIRVYLAKSNDNGVTWSAPVKLNYLTKGKNFWLQNGPGKGLYANDVIIFPMYTNLNGNISHNQAVLVYSKDHGKTWSLSNPVGQANAEPQVVELPGGNIMANMRTLDGNGYREVAITSDLGNTWSKVYSDSTLIDSGCQASIINYVYKNQSLLIFSNPADKSKRKNLVLNISDFEGKNWYKKIPIYQGSAGYSCLSQLSNGNVGLLFEADNYTRIVFKEIPKGDLF